jgi:type II secretory pathway component PulF
MQAGAIISAIALSAAIFAVIYFLFYGKKLSQRHLFEFSTKMANYLNADMPIIEAIEELIREYSPASVTMPSAMPSHFDKCLRLIRSDLAKGLSLAGSMEIRKEYFPEYYVRMVVLGEKTDALPETFTQLTQMQASLSVRTLDVKNALAYPAIVLIFLLMGTLFITDFIAPSYQEMYESLNIEMPGAIVFFTLFAGRAGDILTFLLILTGIAVFYIIANRAKIKPDFDRFVLKIPFIGTLRKYFDYIIVSRSMAFMTERDIPAGKALLLASAACSNYVFKEKLKEAASSYSSDITEKLKETGIFTPAFIWLVSQGESAGALPESMNLIGDYYAEELNLQADKISKIMEVSLVLIAGFITGIMAFGVFVPLMSVSAKIIQNIVVF